MLGQLKHLLKSASVLLQNISHTWPVIFCRRCHLSTKTLKWNQHHLWHNTTKLKKLHINKCRSVTFAVPCITSSKISGVQNSIYWHKRLTTIPETFVIAFFQNLYFLQCETSPWHWLLPSSCLGGMLKYLKQKVVQNNKIIKRKSNYKKENKNVV